MIRTQPLSCRNLTSFLHLANGRTAVIIVLKPGATQDQINHVVERVEAPPNNLGMGFRSFVDFGCREQNPRGAVKMKGEV